MLVLNSPQNPTGGVIPPEDIAAIADLVRDIAVYRDAKSAAESIVAADPELRAPAHAGLRSLVEGEPSARAMLLSS